MTEQGPSSVREPLVFTRYDVSSLGVPSLVFTNPRELMGIYILEFADGFRYVGKTVNIISRSGTHRRHHGDVAAISFAPCARGDLDHFERQTIQTQESEFSLRNKLLTNLPGGSRTARIVTREGVTAELPWQREARPRASLRQGESSHSAKLGLLEQRADYEQLKRALAVYIDQTIPDPTRTAGVLWSLSVLPRTSGGRLFTLNCGSLETLRAAEYVENGKPMLLIALNVALNDEMDERAETGEEGEETEDSEWFQSQGIVELYEGRYRRALAWTIVFDSWFSFTEFLDDPEMADAAYQLNTQLMRQSKSVYRRFHDDSFADLLLSTMAASAADPSESAG